MSGAVTRFESGPFFPFDDTPTATYVRAGAIAGRPMSGPSPAGG